MAVFVSCRAYGSTMSNRFAPIVFPVPGVDVAIARWAYEGEAAELIRRLKYGRSTSVVGVLARELCAISPPCDVVSWIPATPQRRRNRGFDQGELLARAVARRLGVRSRSMLRRVDHRAQTSRDLAGRLQGPRFRAAGRRPSGAERVLLIDDVSTTGSTIASAAAALAQSWNLTPSAVVIAKVVTKGATHERICRSRVSTHQQYGGQAWKSPSVAGMSESRRDWRR